MIYELFCLFFIFSPPSRRTNCWNFFGPFEPFSIPFLTAGNKLVRPFFVFNRWLYCRYECLPLKMFLLKFEEKKAKICNLRCSLQCGICRYIHKMVNENTAVSVNDWADFVGWVGWQCGRNPGDRMVW
jgi:hypothetical protein